MQKVLKGKIVILTLSLIIVGMVAGLVEADETITVTDSDNFEVEIDLPVETIVCTSSALNEILVALGVEDKIVGRDEWSDISPVLEKQKNIPVVASSSFRLQIEAIAELDPDLVIADTMLQDDARDKLAIFDIPAIGERTSEADNIYNVISRVAQIVDREERGEEIIDYISDYRELIRDRVADVENDDQPRMFWEWRDQYQSGSSTSTVQPRIDLASAINIAADAEGRFPQLSSEYVIQENPEIIIRMESRGTSIEVLRESYNEIKSRTGLDQTAAVKNDRVYIMTQAINTGLSSIVGDLFFAKMAHPDLFEDIDPGAVYRDLMDKFYEVEIDEQVLYPNY